MKTIKQATKYQQSIANAHLVSNGIPYEDTQKPIIGVVNSFNEIVPGHTTLRQIADQVKNGVRMNGGLPLEFNTIAVCDGIAQGHTGMKYPLPSREIIADSIEVMVRAHGIFDGLVFVTGCDKITPGMLMAAARLDIPSIFISGGPSHPYKSGAERKALRRNYFDGKIGEQELAEGHLCFYSTPGVCAFYGTATTMLTMTEGLGMALSGTSLAPAYSGERLIAAEQTGKRIVELVREDIRPSQILTKNSFHNAATLLAALGGSLNALLHLPAVAEELSIDLSWETFDEISSKVPLLATLIPNGPHHVVDLHFAGGVPAVLKELQDALALDVTTVDATSLRDTLSMARVADNEVIASKDSPFAKQGGIAVLKGNLAPQGAIVKQSAVPKELYSFTGKAVVFENEEECTKQLEANQVPEHTVLVIRNEGPKGGPGMREMHRITEMVGRLKNVAVITDGRFSGASAGLSVGYVSPEAALNGPIGRVQTGDEILIDINQRKLELLVPSEELTSRKPVERQSGQEPKGYLRRYQQEVGQTHKGACLK